MKPRIKNISLYPITTGRRVGPPSQHIIVKISTDCGVVGVGEMSDLSHLPAVMPDADDLQKCLNIALVGENPFDIEAINQKLLANFPGTRFYGKSSIIRCGIDIALYDLLGKLLKQPAYNLIGGRCRKKVPVCCPVFRPKSEEDVKQSLKEIAEYIGQGFHQFRYYFGADLDLDERLLDEAFSRHGADFNLVSLDASGLLTPAEFLKGYRRLKRFEFLLVESPVERNDLQGMAEVRSRIEHPVSEHIRSLEYGLRALKLRAVDIFNVSITVAGGITYARRLFALAESAGIDCLIGTTQELGMGTAAQAHLGVSCPNLNYVSNPAGPLVYTQDIVATQVSFENGYLIPPEGYGLGIDIDEDRLQELGGRLTMEPQLKDSFSRG